MKLLTTLALCFMYTIGSGQLVNNASELNSAINAAGPGTDIILADGTWKDVFIDLDKNGTESEPITISAQNTGAVLMTGNSRVYMEGTYLTVSGLVFQDPENLVGNSSEIEPIFELKRCNNCKIINNKIDRYNGTESQKDLKFKWVLADGENNEIAYNSFIGKYGVGSIINDNRNTSEPDYLKIHHNYFANRTPINGVNDDNDQDAIRIGNSATSLDDSFTEVYDNYFFNFFGEVEVISNKSGQNKYYNNTFRKYAGTLTLRHGDNCEVYGNYFFAEDNTFSGGIRVIGEGHRIYNNYIEGVNSTKEGGSLSNATGGINVSNGRLNSAVNGYYQVKDCQVVNNTFVDCDYGMRVGTTVSSDLDQEPINLIVANNVMYNTSDNAYQIATEPSGTSISEGNLTSLADDEMMDDGNFHRIVDGSSPIDAGLGSYGFLSQDVLGGERDSNIDAGAEEYGANGTNLPFNDLDVGVKIGFGANSEPTLRVSPSEITFGRSGGSTTFEVISNVDWTIENDISWLSVDISSGSGRTTITATADENPTGSERTEPLTINGTSGGLTTELSVIQLNTFLPTEIQIVGATTIGMQDKDGITTENAYDDNTGTYWTGDPDTEAEVSITFDLNCRHELTEIGINFWKADERTTTFSVDVAKEESGPFTTIVDNETSDSDAFVGTEQLYSLNNTVAQYVRFTGIGNSSTSNWTSIANVNIYGDLECADGTSLDETNQEALSFNVFPNPTSSGLLNIKSTTLPISQVEIYNTTGQLLITKHIQGLYSTQVNITDLEKGTYIVKLKDIGQTQFIILN